MLLLVWSILVIGTVGLLAKFLHWYYTEARRIIQMSSSLPTPGRHWLFGSLHLLPALGEKLLNWYSTAREKHGEIFVVWLGPFSPWVTICSGELAKDILRTEEPKPSGIPGYGVFQGWLGGGLFLSHGDAWKRNRRLVTPSFFFDMLKAYLDVFNKSSDTFRDYLDTVAEDGQSIDVFAPSKLLTLDSTLKCVFSIEENMQVVGEKHIIPQLNHEVQNLSFTRWFSPWLWPDFLFYLSPKGRRYTKISDQIHEISREIIKNRKKELEGPDTGTAMKLDFLNSLLIARDEDGYGLTDDEIMSEVSTFMFAGTDTTSSTISWVLYALTINPDAQEACREEVRQVLHDRHSDDVTFDDLDKLPYLTMCIKETLRLHTVVMSSPRQLSHDLQIGDHLLPKGCIVDVHMYQIHKDPKVWENPDQFIPERFTPENCAARGAYDFIPFSAGPRNCIGQNFAMNHLKVSLVKVLNRFKVTYDSSHPVKKIPQGVMKAEDGVWLKFDRF